MDIRFNPYDPAFDADPFPVYHRLREDAPCFWSEDARMWVLTRYDDIFRALGDWRTYSSSKGNLMDEFPGRAGNTLGSMDPPRHDRVRGIIAAVFAKQNLEHLEQPIRELARQAIAGLGDARRFDFTNDFSARVTVGLLSALFDLPAHDYRELRDTAVMMVQSDPVTRRKGPQHIAAYEWMKAYAGRILEQRRLKPGSDLVTQLLEAQVDGARLSNDEVQLTVTTLIMAGVESLSGFLNMFALNLADFPDARRQLVANPALIPDAIEESLRYNTTAQRFRRVLQRDVELHGQTMKAGDFVALCYGAGNRDDRKYPDADRYDIGRRPRGHLGFGGGVHACLGSMIARLATRLVTEEFLAAVPEFGRAERELRWVPSSTFRSPLKLELTRPA
jgi:cytochrome P450